MGTGDILLVVLFAAFLLLAIGHSFIHTFFDYKEGMIKRTIESQRGEL